MPARVLDGWRRFEAVEPFGPRQEDFRAGQVASLLATIYRDKKQHKDPYVPSEFFHSLLSNEAVASAQAAESHKPRPPGQLLQIMETLFLSHAVDNRGKRPRYEE